MDRTLVRGQLLRLDDGDYEVVRPVGAAVLLRSLDGHSDLLVPLEDVPVAVSAPLMMRDPRFDRRLSARLQPAERMLVESKQHAVEVVLGIVPPDDERLRLDPRPSLTALMDSQIDARRKAQLPASANSLRNWKKRYLAGGALALRDMRSVRQKLPSGYTDERILTVIDEVIEEYSVRSDVTVKLKIKKVRERALARHADDEKPLTIPSDRTLRRRYGEREEYAKTHGTARQRHTQSLVPDRMFNRRPVLFPGQEMQADTSSIDLLHVDRKGRAKRGKVTFLVDVATRTRAGMVVTEGSPTGKDHAFMLLSSMTTVRVAARPVLPWTVDLSGYEWADGWTSDEVRAAFEQQPFIQATRVHIDNGRDYQAHVLQGITDYLGVDTSYANPHTPTDKPEVERGFGSFESLLMEDLPGFIASSTEHRGDEPDPATLLDIYTLTAVIQAWLVIRWNNRPHPALRDPKLPGALLTPAQMYDVMFDHTGAVPYALTREEFIRLLPPERRVCRPDGFHIKNFRYDSKLVTFHGEPCPYTEDGKWPVHHLPSNPSVAWVAAPDGSLIELEWMNGDFYLQPYNRAVQAGARQVASRFNVERDPKTVANIARILSATDAARGHAEREQDRATANAALADQLGLQIPGPAASRHAGKDRGGAVDPAPQALGPATGSGDRASPSSVDTAPGSGSVKRFNPLEGL